jgi:transcriptional regulator with XRE-family HTH domain
LVERTKRDPARAARIDALVAAASVEHVLQTIMESERVSAAELARRLNAKPPQISRDLHGGLSKATLSRLVSIAKALGYDFVPVFVPRSHAAKRRRFFEAYRGLIPDAPPALAAKTTRRTEATRSTKTAKPVRRKVA